MQMRDWKKVRTGKTKTFFFFFFKNGCFTTDWTFDFSKPAPFLLFQEPDMLWIPDHLWTQATVEKVAVGSRRPD